jgi:hypothetical protein
MGGSNMRPRPVCHCSHIDSCHRGYDGKCFVCRCRGFEAVEKSLVKEQREKFYQDQLAKLKAAIEAEPNMDYDSRVILLKKFGDALREAIDLGYQIEYDLVYPTRLLEIICNPYEYPKNIINAGRALRDFLGLKTGKSAEEAIDNKDRELIEAYEKRKAKLALVRKNE